MELRVKAKDESLEAVNDFIHSALPSDCNEMILNQIDLAVEEIFVNIAHYSGSEEAIINCRFENGMLEIKDDDELKMFIKRRITTCPVKERTLYKYYLEYWEMHSHW